ncbi:MAG: C40 family peptidase [Clostridia bacterium]|nr:C40 family peptidase [Clostridia bacterium]
MSKIAAICILIAVCFSLGTVSYASLTKEQSDDVAEFATSFIEEGNKRRDKNGYPLLVYALSSNWQTCIDIRASGYNGELYYIKNNKYHGNRDLGYKWCMDCGDFMSYVYKTTLGFDLINHDNGDPWHITDFRDDANKGSNSKYFEYVYKNVSIASIDESKLMPGDLVIRFGPKDNHGLVYIGEGWRQAHASYNAIKYSANPPITGFQVVNGFYKKSTIISVIRVKDGIVPKDQKVNGTIIWPDTGEEAILIERERLERIEKEELENAFSEENTMNAYSGDTLVTLDMSNPLIIKEFIEQNSDDFQETRYIEKDMINWLDENLRKFYEEQQKNEDE